MLRCVHRTLFVWCLFFLFFVGFLCWFLKICILYFLVLLNSFLNNLLKDALNTSFLNGVSASEMFIMMVTPIAKWLISMSNRPVFNGRQYTLPEKCRSPVIGVKAKTYRRNAAVASPRLLESTSRTRILVQVGFEHCTYAHWAISRSSQCPTTGVTKACLWDGAYKRTPAANWKE